MNVAFSNMELINGLHQSSEEAIRHLYDLHYRALCYFADNLLNDKKEAEDIATESFLKLLKKKDDFDKVSDIRSFLFTATRNACFDVLRKNKRKDKLNRDLAHLSEPDEIFGEQEMITAKVLQVIYAAVNELPHQRREVFTAIYMKGKTTAEVAAEMNLSEQTVLNQKNKALQTLRLTLYKEGLYSTGVFVYCLTLLSGQQLN